MKNVIVNGATSFIGIHLIKELLNNEYEVTAIIRENSNKKELLQEFDIKIIELNMENIKQLKNYNIACETFFNFAWCGTRGSLRNNKTIQRENYINSINTLNILKYLKCKTYFSSGSQAEYGIFNDKINEETICNPNTEYGKYKYKFYLYAKDYCKKNNIRFIEPRYFSLYGPLDYSESLIMNSLKCMIENKTIEITKYMQIWNYLNVKDAIKLLIKMNESSVEGVFNVGSNDTRTLKSFIEEMKKITNTKSIIKYGNNMQEEKIININPDISKSISTFNWKPNITFEEGIEEIIELIRK